MYEQPVRKPTRLRGVDYAAAGAYFVTMCVQHMEPRFGTIRDGQVILNTAGEMVARVWEENIARYPGTELDAYVVMPNHMHAIVFLGTDPDIDLNAALTRIVQSFKSLTTVEYTRGVRDGIYPPYERILWQRSFNERILRDDREMDIVRTYIESNPGRAQEKHDSLPGTPWRSSLM